MRTLLLITRALSDESRLRALNAVKNGELCLCQIVQVLARSPSTVSRHMHVLEQSGLVECTRRGKWRYYKLADGSESRSVKRALAWVLKELRSEPRLTEDARKIRKVRQQDLEELTACYRG